MADLPASALPASGSRGRPIGPLSHCGSPAFSFSVRLRLSYGKSTAASAAHSGAGRGIREPNACSQTANEKLSPGWCLFHVRVKDRLPLPLVFLPHRAGVVSSGLVLPVVRAFDGHFVRRHTCIRASRCHFVVTDCERFHVPLLHVRQLLLHIGDAFDIDTHHVCGNELFEVVRLFVLKRLPGCFLFFLHCVVVCRGGRNGNRPEQRDHCVADILFHGVLSL